MLEALGSFVLGFLLQGQIALLIYAMADYVRRTEFTPVLVHSVQLLAESRVQVSSNVH